MKVCSEFLDAFGFPCWLCREFGAHQQFAKDEYADVYWIIYDRPEKCVSASFLISR